MIGTLLAIVTLTTLPAAAEVPSVCDRPQADLDAVDAQLLEAWKADKADREAQSPDVVKNDAKRVKAVAKIVEKGWVCSPMNAFHAGWVLQHGEDPAHVQWAHDFAKKAMEGRIQNGAWLSAVTYDLLQVTYGRPQRFGTQMITVDGKTCIYPVLSETTDDERKSYQIRPIADTYRQVLDANGLANAAAARASIDRESLWCAPKVVEGAAPVEQ